MNLVRVMLAGLGAFVAYMGIGGLMFAVVGEAMKREFKRYPTVYRSEESMKSVMPAGMAAMLVAILVLAVFWAKMYPAGAGWVSGLEYGALVGVFCVCSFVIHNWVNLNIGVKITVQQSLAYFVQWTVVGLVIGAIYKP